MKPELHLLHYNEARIIRATGCDNQDRRTCIAPRRVRAKGKADASE